MSYIMQMTSDGFIHLADANYSCLATLRDVFRWFVTAGLCLTGRRHLVFLEETIFG